MTTYVAIDKETWTNIAVGTSKENVLKEVWDQDVYFLSEEDFNRKFENRYTIQEWDVNLDERNKIRKNFQRTLVQYNMTIAYLENSIRRNKSNISEAQLAVVKVQREAIQELYNELFKEEE